MREFLIHLPRNCKRIILATNDLLFIEVSLLACFYLRLGWDLEDIVSTYQPVFWLTPLCVLFFLYRQGLYSSITRHAGVEMLAVIARGITFGILTVLLIFFLVPVQPPFPRSVFLAFWLIGILLLFAARLIAGKWLHGTSISTLAMEFAGWKTKKSVRGKPVAIYGAGDAGRQLVGALAQGDQFRPVGFLDDNKKLQGEVVCGLKVNSPGELQNLIDTFGRLEVFLALPSANRRRRQEIIRFLEPFDVHVRSVPSMEELAKGLVTVDEIREVDVADVLGRDSVPPDESLLTTSISGRRMLVTGAGGSIGSELCRHILKYGPELLVMLDHSEYSLYSQYSELEDQVSKTGSTVRLVPVIGTILDGQVADSILRKHDIDTVYHAAAYKHVPLVETNGYQAFQNNVVGTLRLAISSMRAGVEQFVLVSTDKAVRPTNLMGATKRLAEMVLQAFSQEPYLDPETVSKLIDITPGGVIANNTRFTMVRFGNVLDSSGSVIPKFRKQIRKGGPVTVTDPEVTRFFMTIPEAAELVLQANALSNGGDLFVLDMGSPVKIDDLARKLIHLSGLSLRDEANPDGDIEIIYTGIRPGEKLFEELLIDNRADATSHPKIWRADERAMAWSDLQAVLNRILLCYREGNEMELLNILMAEEIGYRPLPVPETACRTVADGDSGVRRTAAEQG